jgi:hypothetical protein
MNESRASLLWLVLVVVIAASWVYWNWHSGITRPAVDEATAAGKTPADFPQADENYFHDMDGGIALTSDEVKGRNTWLVWTAGDDAFWDYLANNSVGALDLLKIVSSHPALPWEGRDGRFHYMGVMNEPGFVQARGPDPRRFGLWLDKRVGPPDPFENATKYPGVHGGSFYGWATGIVGLRLFPNPAFDEAARRRWDPVRYYTDRSYYQDQHLVRPYRVGMSCAFCHASFNPDRPPADPEHPEWRNLTSYVGAQYLRSSRIFFVDRDPHNFLWQLLEAQAPGTIDTSFLATDSINNPRAMNGIYEVFARLQVAQRFGTERLAGGALRINQLPAMGGVVSFIPPNTVLAPHILKDGADSVGVLGAIERVYVSIGEYHEDWVRHFNILVGGKAQTPFEVANAQKNSVYFNATAQRAPNVALFFVKAARPFHLRVAPGGASYLTADEAILRRGRIAFAENCARCHSSKQPPDDVRVGSAQYDDWMRHEVLKPDFLEGNFLSTDQRHPISEIGTNVCSAVASDAIRGHVWDNFSSETYKQLPPAGTISVQNPIDGSSFAWTLPDGGRGYVRVPSLVSVWSSAPLFQNNSLGTFVDDPSVAGRMKAFDESIGLLLWPERRKPEIYRTTDVSYFTVPRGYLPDFLRFYPADIRIGPVPKGTPINLIANIDLDGADRLTLVKVIAGLLADLGKIDAQHLDEQQSADLLRRHVPDLLAVSKCPDFVLNHGHMFGTQLSDADKRALIEFLKTF